MNNGDFYKRNFAALGIIAMFVLVVSATQQMLSEGTIAENVVGGQNVAGAMCGLTGWSFGVSNCMPAGPGKCTGSDKPGLDMCPCTSSGSYMGTSFTVTGVCMGGCCQAKSWPSSMDGLFMSGQLSERVLGSILGQAAGQVLQTVLGKLMGGGASSGGSSDSSSYTYDNGTSDTTNSLLTYDTYTGSSNVDTSSSSGFSLTDWIFGSNDSSSDSSASGETTTSGSSSGTAGTNGDSVSTSYGTSGGNVQTYETQAVGNNTIDAMSDVERDLAYTTLETGTEAPAGTVPTTESLEWQGLEAQARLAQLGGGKGSLSVSYEGLSDTDKASLEDYGTSNIARSRGTESSASESGTDTQSDEPFWEKAINFIKMLFGAN